MCASGSASAASPLHDVLAVAADADTETMQATMVANRAARRTLIKPPRPALLFPVPALPAGAAVVVFADIFVQPRRVPLRLGDDLELLRPRRGEDLRIVDRQLVRQRVLTLPLEALDRVERVAVHPVFLRVRVVVVVERPA